MTTQLERVTVPSGQSISTSFQLRYGIITAIFVNSDAWTTANLTFQGSMDGGTFYDLYNGDEEYVVTPLVGSAHKLDPVMFAGWKYIRLRSGNTGDEVAQNGLRTITAMISEQI